MYKWKHEPKVDLSRVNHYAPNGLFFSSAQSAIETILESLGAYKEPIPVYLSVCSSFQTISACFRGGGIPCLIDIDPITLQLDCNEVREVLKEYPEGVWFVNSPLGSPVNQELKDLLREQITIIDYPNLPPKLLSLDFGFFHVWNLTPKLGQGALLIHPYSDQQKVLEALMAGIMGRACYLSKYLIGEYTSWVCDHSEEEYSEYQANYDNLFNQLHDYVKFYPYEFGMPYAIIKVENRSIKELVPFLDMEEVLSSAALVNLSKVPVIRSRYPAEPKSFVNLESLEEKLIAIPLHQDPSIVASLIKEFVCGEVKE